MAQASGKDRRGTFDDLDLGGMFADGGHSPVRETPTTYSRLACVLPLPLPLLLPLVSPSLSPSLALALARAQGELIGENTMNKASLIIDVNRLAAMLCCLAALPVAL